MRVLFQTKNCEACELMPCVRSILITHPLTGKRATRFISFPYLQLALIGAQGQYRSVAAGMSKLPWTNDNSVSFPLPLPNSYENFHVCGITANSLEELCKVFWNSRFQGNGYPGCLGLEKSSMKNLNIWQKMTLMAPEFILSEGCNYGTKPLVFKKTIEGLAKQF